MVGGKRSVSYDVMIVGAGAAGLMCAIEAGKRGRRVLVLDHAKAAGEKIRISGGGRCNFTNLYCSEKQFISQNPHFCISALRRYTQHDFIALVEKYDISYHEKTLGQLFCDGSSKQIVTMLLEEAQQVGVELRLNTGVNTLDKTDDAFAIEVSDGKTIQAQSVVIATGGPSIPKMGASDWGYRIAKQFGLKMVEPQPALVAFTLASNELEQCKALTGVSLAVEVRNARVTFAEGMLFTHRGLSGPSMLQMSSYWQQGEAIEVDLLPGRDMFVALKSARETQAKQELQTVLAQWLPKKVAHYLCGHLACHARVADLSNAKLQEIVQAVQAWKVIPNGTEGYRTAEVTRGGVDTDELSSKSFESKRVQGLYFIGEVVDVTGWLGGYNFQWAWSSGYAAGQYV